jgi:hypothetical protein
LRGAEAGIFKEMIFCYQPGKQDQVSSEKQVLQAVNNLVPQNRQKDLRTGK